jgi:hypothetical protein
MKRLLFSLLCILCLSVLAQAQNTYSGGVSGSVTGNCLPKSSGNRSITTSSACDDGTTFSIATNKVTITEASGNTAIAGTLGVTGDVAVATSKFTVAASTGNTLVAGTLASTGAIAINGGATVATGQTLAVTDADKLTIGGVIVPQEIEITFHGQPATEMVDQTFFVANQAYQVTKVRFVAAVAEASAGTLLVQLVKDTGTDAPGAGTDLLTNNTNAGFDTKATANTVQAGTLTGTGASLQLVAGNRLSVDFSAAATELVGVTITVTLKRI